MVVDNGLFGLAYWAYQAYQAHWAYQAYQAHWA